MRGSNPAKPYKDMCFTCWTVALVPNSLLFKYSLSNMLTEVLTLWMLLWLIKFLNLQHTKVSKIPTPLLCDFQSPSSFSWSSIPWQLSFSINGQELDINEHCIPLLCLFTTNEWEHLIFVLFLCSYYSC